MNKWWICSVGLHLVIALHSAPVCSQSAYNSCNEMQGSPQKLFVFVGKLLKSEPVFTKELVNLAKYTATYSVIEKICGDSPGDTIQFDITQTFRDPSFKEHPFQLLMLVKDTAAGEPYVLWGGLNFFVQPSSKNRWLVPYTSQFDGLYVGQKPLRPRKLRFSKDAYFDVEALSREESDISFPEPYYKIKGKKAIPIWGYTIDEVLRHEKEGTLASAGIFDWPVEHYQDTIGRVQISEVQLEELTPAYTDSLNRVLNSECILIKDSLTSEPFNTRLVQKLIENCRLREDYAVCEQFFDSLTLKYPDSSKTYILWAKFRHPRVSLEDSSRLPSLLKAFEKDSTIIELSIELGKSYYSMFLETPNAYHAYQSRKYFIKCIDLDPDGNKLFKFHIIQLSEYLNDTLNINRYSVIPFPVITDYQGIPIARQNNWHFPFDKLMARRYRGPDGTYTDMTALTLGQKYLFDDCSELLRNFKEPLIDSSFPSKIYRLLWVRSFHEPILIKIQSSNGKVVVIWKQLEAVDSAGTLFNVTEHSKKLGQRHLKKFERSLKEFDFWNMVSHNHRGWGVDGALWLFEASANGKYQITIRQGYSYPKYTKSLTYLIRLTDLRIPEKNIY